jgi:hypothetical protein
MTKKAKMKKGRVAKAKRAPAALPAPDAELLGLGRQLDQLRQAYALSHAFWGPIWVEQDKRLREWSMDHPKRTESQVRAAYVAIADELAANTTQPHPDNLLGGDGVSFQRAIMDIPATTLAGLAVKAKLAKFSASELWYLSDDDADWGDLAVRKLIDAVIDTAAGK